MKKRNKTRLVAVGAIGVIVIASPLISGAVLCHDNVPIVDFCPVASCMAKVFGYEAGLRHQMNDLERFEGLQMYGDESVAEVTVQDVKYQDKEDVYYVLPPGFVLTSDENGKPIGRKAYQSNESSEVQYLETDPIVVSGNSDKVIYDYLLISEDQTTVNIFNANWSYVDGEFVNAVYESEQKMNLKQN